MLDDKTIIERLQSVSNSQDQIPSLSLYLLAPNKIKYHTKIVKLWMKVLEKSKPSHRLTLFNLANDVIQHARRKTSANVFLEDFKEVLKDATLLVKHDQVRPKVQRIFNIWRDRRVYSEEFIAELTTILNGSSVNAANSKIVLEFKLDSLIDRVKKLQKRSEARKLKGEMVNQAKLHQICNSTGTGKGEDIIHRLKDKTSGEQIQKDIDGVERSLIEVVHAMEREVETRISLVELLEKSAIFYETQQEEAKIVANAYQNFAVRVENVHKKLNENFTISGPSPNAEADSDNDLLPPKVVDPNGFAGLQAIMDLVAEEKKSEQQSSLDKRLSHLMQDVNKSINNIPLPPSPTISSAAILTSMHPQSTMHAASSTGAAPLSEDDFARAQLTFLQTQAASQHFPTLYRPPPPPAIPPPMNHHQQALIPSHMPSNDHRLSMHPDLNHYNPSQPQYAYTEPTSSYPFHPINSNDSVSTSNIQPIQAVVSSRSGSTSSVGGDDSITIPGITSMPQSDPNWSFLSETSTAHDNTENVDMDVESDDESPPRGATTHPGMMHFPQRTLKVIETHPLPSSAAPIPTQSGPSIASSSNINLISTISTNSAHGSNIGGDGLDRASQPINAHYTHYVPTSYESTSGPHYSRQPPSSGNMNKSGAYNRTQYSPTSSNISVHRHQTFAHQTNHQKAGRQGHGGRNYRH